MNILFNALRCGLGNNGGTKTILRTAETLKSLGHGVVVQANVNLFSWFKSKCLIKPYHEVGIMYDCIVAVSVMDLEHTLESHIENKWWFMRAWPSWVHGEEWLIQQIKKFVSHGGKIIVNSSWLIGQLKEKCNVHASLCYSGLDLDTWYEETPTVQYRLGAMEYNKHITKRTDIIKSLPDYYSLNNISINDNYNDNQLRQIYNQCKMWVAPTELEGFHQVAAEANLCGCLIICNRMISNGMSDYATDQTAMRYDNPDEIIDLIDNPDFSKVKKMQDILINEIGSREDNMKKFINILEG